MLKWFTQKRNYCTLLRTKGLVFFGNLHTSLTLMFHSYQIRIYCRKNVKKKKNSKQRITILYADIAQTSNWKKKKAWINFAYATFQIKILLRLYSIRVIKQLLVYNSQHQKNWGRVSNGSGCHRHSFLMWLPKVWYTSTKDASHLPEGSGVHQDTLASIYKTA